MKISEIPLHKRQKLVSATLSKELRKKFGKRSLPIRKGDTVKIMRGDFKGHKGKVERVNLKKLKIYVHGATVTKADGSEKLYPIHPSNVKIIKASMNDSKRKKIIERAKA